MSREEKEVESIGQVVGGVGYIAAILALMGPIGFIPLLMLGTGAVVTGKGMKGLKETRPERRERIDVSESTFVNTPVTIDNPGNVYMDGSLLRSSGELSDYDSDEERY